MSGQFTALLTAMMEIVSRANRLNGPATTGQAQPGASTLSRPQRRCFGRDSHSYHITRRRDEPLDLSVFPSDFGASSTNLLMAEWWRKCNCTPFQANHDSQASVHRSTKVQSTIESTECGGEEKLRFDAALCGLIGKRSGESRRFGHVRCTTWLKLATRVPSN